MAKGELGRFSSDNTVGGVRPQNALLTVFIFDGKVRIGN